MIAGSPLFFYDIVTVLQPHAFKSLRPALNPLHNQHQNELRFLFIQRPALRATSKAKKAGGIPQQDQSLSDIPSYDSIIVQQILT